MKTETAKWLTFSFGWENEQDCQHFSQGDLSRKVNNLRKIMRNKNYDKSSSCLKVKQFWKWNLQQQNTLAEALTRVSWNSIRKLWTKLIGKKYETHEVKPTKKNKKYFISLSCFQGMSHVQKKTLPSSKLEK